MDSPCTAIALDLPGKMQTTNYRGDKNSRTCSAHFIIVQATEQCPFRQLYWISIMNVKSVWQVMCWYSMWTSHSILRHSCSPTMELARSWHVS